MFVLIKVAVKSLGNTQIAASFFMFVKKKINSGWAGGLENSNLQNEMVNFKGKKWGTECHNYGFTVTFFCLTSDAERW